MSSPISMDALRAARWFAGKHRRIAAVRTVGAWWDGAVCVLDVEYADDDEAGDRYLVLAESLAWTPLLRSLVDAPLRGPAGRIELRPGPALGALLRGGDERVPSTDQSNTLV